MGPIANRFEKLPDEIIYYIFTNLDPKSLQNCKKVDKRFNQIGSDRHLYVVNTEVGMLSRVQQIVKCLNSRQDASIYFQSPDGRGFDIYIHSLGNRNPIVKQVFHYNLPTKTPSADFSTEMIMLKNCYAIIKVDGGIDSHNKLKSQIEPLLREHLDTRDWLQSLLPFAKILFLSVCAKALMSIF